MDERHNSLFFGKPKYYFTITSLMILIFVMIISYFAHNGIEHIQKIHVINIGMSILAMLISIVLFLNVGMDDIRKPKSTSFFQLNMLVLFFMFANNAICWSYKPDLNIKFKYLLDSNIYIFDYLELFCFGLYLDTKLPKKNKVRKIIDKCLYFLYTVMFILIFTNPVTNIFFYYEDGNYTRGKYFIFCSFFIYFILFIYLININIFFRGKFIKRIAYSSFSLISIISVIFHFSFYGLILLDVGFFISIIIIYAYVQVEERGELIKKKNELTSVRTDVMLSQIQPHFLYNSLATISSLCDFDPLMAQNATDRFAAYLRMNLYTIKCKNNINFIKELEHIQTYLWLEQLRFENRLTVEYDTPVTDFYLPPLSIQPIVENSVKHGILAKENGGKIKITTKENRFEYIIIIEDDGIGFDVEKIQNSEDGIHIGMASVTQRIKNICHGEIKIKSVINKGTIVTISLPKSYAVPNEQKN